MEFCNGQIDAILQQEEDDYIWQVIHKIKDDERLTLPNEDIKDLFNRLKETYHYIIGLGFTKKNLIEAYLYGEAVTPGYKDNPIIKNWVEKENHNPEEQYKDLLIIAEKKQKGLL